MEAFFAVRELAVGYNGSPLIRDIEMRLERGRILALIGPNGSGKSTILKTLTGYLKQLHGTVLISGDAIDDLKPAALARRVSVVLTGRLQTEHMSCEDVVESGRYPYTGSLGILSKEDHACVAEAMALVHATELRDRDFGRLSDGQRQRVLLARAIAQQPEIIVLDEPTSFLDIHYQLELMEILRMLARERGIAVILSIHELELAQRVADDVLCVKGETIAHYARADEIFREDLIRELYDLDGGSFNPLFGSLELRRPAGAAETFVIAGGGTGIPAYRALQRARIPFATGVLHENDVDYQVARALASETISERAFEPIGEDAFCRARESLSGCKRVLNCLTQWGAMNQKNAELLRCAEALKLPVFERVEQLIPE